MTLLALAALLVAGVLFLGGEALRRRLKGSNEVSRKLVHVLHGLTVIAWLFVASNTFIAVFESLFFVGMFVVRELARRWPQYAWLHQVGRTSWGEFFYPVGVIISLLVAQSDWFVVVAVAQLAVSDAIAALVGQKWGANNAYVILGNKKSVVGTLAFVATGSALSLAVLLPSMNLTGAALLWAVLTTPVILAAVENVSGQGSDNFTIPVVCVLLLNLVG